ncbi:MAG TPA: AAA family ATPase, partial [Solirubrobacteraceae bacterium]
MLEIGVLGPLTARADGADLPLPADARARELLAYLALHPGRHPRSALAGRLRPEVPEESARKSLRDAVYRLRAALGPAAHALVATRDEVALDGATVDAAAFERLRREGDLAAAAELARGELLAGLDADWVLRARDAHAAQVVELLAALADRAEAAGDLDGAIAWARRRIDHDPLGEAGHRELVRLLARADDRPAALAVASAFAERLRRELGVPPSPATRTLVEDVRLGRLGPDAQATPAVTPGPPGGAHRALPPPLARTGRPRGRERALARLAAAWAEAAGGAPRVALLAGEPGIGKTTVAGELARRVHARGAPVFYGRSDEHALVPFQPWIALLEAQLAQLGPDEAARRLTRHDGALARLLPTRDLTAERPAGPRERYLAFEAARALVEQAAGEAPALLVLDDLHWADGDSLALLRHVVLHAAHMPVLVLLIARTAELSPEAAETLADLRRHAGLAEVRLIGLDEPTIAELLGERTGESGLEVARTYRRRTGGNPFFLDALLREERDGDGASGPPPGVRDVVTRRLDRLAPSCREILATCAVLGLEWELGLAAEVAGRPIAEALEAFDEAHEAGLVDPAGAPGRFAFAHALVRETLLTAMPSARRAQRHLEVSAALAVRGSAAGEVVRHLRSAAPLAPGDERLRWELAAAREATEALAHSEAAGHLRAALQHASPGERVEVLLALGTSEHRAGRRQEAREAFRAAAELARGDGDPVRLARAALGFGGLGVVIAAPDEPTQELLEEALAAQPDGDRRTAALVRARLAVEVYYADPARTLALAEQAVADARESGDGEALTAALNAMRVGLWEPGAVHRRLAVVTEMLETALAGHDREAALQARNWRVVDLWELGRLPEVRAEIDAYAALADEVGLPHFRWYVPFWRAGLALMAGRWQDAADLGDAALALGEQGQDANAPLFVGIQRRLRYAVQYRHRELDRDALERTAAASPVPAAWLGWLANLDGLLGEHERARRIVAELTADDGAALPLDANWHVTCEVAEAAADVRDLTACAVLRRRLAPLAGLYPVIARAVCTENVVDYYLGRMAHALGEHAEAEVHLRRAVALNDAAGARPYAAVAQLRLGEVLAAADRREEARAALEDAAARAEPLGMPAVGEMAAASIDRLTSAKGARA